MNFVKRGILYTTRKKGKTISLFLLMLVVATFLTCCFSILSASQRLSKEIRTSFGAAFYLRGSTEVSWNDGEASVDENSIDVSQSEIDSIMSSGEISYYNPINYGFAKSDAITFVAGDGYNEASNMGKVTALNFSALAPDFTDETASLVEGSHIIDSDTKKIIISDQLASANNLSVGDSITLTHAKLGESEGEYIDEIEDKTEFVDVEISGIYHLNVEKTSIVPTPGMSENMIYSSIDVLESLKESTEGKYTGEVDFYVTDPLDMPDLVSEIEQNVDIDWNTHFIRTNDFKYSKISDQLASISDLVTILLVCVSAVSTAILILLLILRIRGRIQEMGVLMAAGIMKYEILGQLIFEVLFITIIAFLGSYIVSYGVVRQFDRYLFQDIHPNLINESTLMTGFSVETSMTSYLNINGLFVIIIYVCQMSVATLATLLASVMIMRLKPKEILSKMS